jgi:tRNA(Glu) U13 pseudouridine synthase TruD
MVKAGARWGKRQLAGRLFIAELVRTQYACELGTHTGNGVVIVVRTKEQMQIHEIR